MAGKSAKMSRPAWTPALALMASMAAPAGLAIGAEDAPRLAMPIACEPGTNCFIQNYVDDDPGPGVRDHACGGATYDGHTGTDFRLLSAAGTQRGVPVLSAAAGRVKGIRDGVADKLMSDQSKAETRGRECGNGIVIDHGGGWETQYCHLLQGSVSVRPGDMVEVGHSLGKVGFSGAAEFAHVHFEVRKDGQPVDPFTGVAGPTACTGAAGLTSRLWTDAAARLLPYVDGQLLDAGFAGDPEAVSNLEREGPVQPTRQSPSLVFYARAANLRAGDEARIEVTGPDGFAVRGGGEPLAHNKAVYRLYAGKRLKTEAWPAGVYEGRVWILRGGQTIAERRAAIELK